MEACILIRMLLFILHALVCATILFYSFLSIYNLSPESLQSELKDAKKTFENSMSCQCQKNTQICQFWLFFIFYRKRTKARRNGLRSVFSNRKKITWNRSVYVADWLDINMHWILYVCFIRYDTCSMSISPPYHASNLTVFCMIEGRASNERIWTSTKRTG